MFPGPGATVYYNEAGEPLGWDYPSEPERCDMCGAYHDSWRCPPDYEDEDEDDGDE